MLYIMLIFSIIGGIDKLLKNKYGLGIKFDEGFKAMGGLALSILGIYSLSPLIARLLIPILNPLADILYTDPSVFISSILASDLGGYTTSMKITSDPVIGQYNGLVLASMLGATISFTIPLALNIISDKDHVYFIKGILAGIVTVPVGMLVSGLLMKIPFRCIIMSIVPVSILSILIALGLMKAQNVMMKIFNILGKIISAIGTLGLILGILDSSFNIRLIKDMIPLEESVNIVLGICIVLSGAYPLLYFLSRRMNSTLKSIKNKLDLDEFSVLGLVSSLANCIPMLGVYNDMNWKGKILNAAFAVSGAFTFGGQLGYVSSVSPEIANSFIAGKLAAGITAMAVALLIIKYEGRKEGMEHEH